MAKGGLVTQAAFREIHWSVGTPKTPDCAATAPTPRKDGCSRSSGMIDPNVDSSVQATQFALAWPGLVAEMLALASFGENHGKVRPDALQRRDQKPTHRASTAGWVSPAMLRPLTLRVVPLAPAESVPTRSPADESTGRRETQTGGLPLDHGTRSALTSPPARSRCWQRLRAPAIVPVSPTCVENRQTPSRSFAPDEAAAHPFAGHPPRLLRQEKPRPPPR